MAPLHVLLSSFNITTLSLLIDFYTSMCQCCFIQFNHQSIDNTVVAKKFSTLVMFIIPPFS